MPSIFSMARNKEFVRQGLRSGNQVRLEHWMKLYFYPQAEYERSKWMTSVYSSCSYTYPWDGKHFLKPHDILYEVWGGDFSDTLTLPMYFAAQLSGVVSQVPEYSPPADRNHPFQDEWRLDFNKRFQEYHEWLATLLGNRGAITTDECSEELDRLLNGNTYWEYYKNTFM